MCLFSFKNLACKGILSATKNWVFGKFCAHVILVQLLPCSFPDFYDSDDGKDGIGWNATSISVMINENYLFWFAHADIGILPTPGVSGKLCQIDFRERCLVPAMSIHRSQGCLVNEISFDLPFHIISRQWDCSGSAYHSSRMARTRNQLHCCWRTGDARSQGFSSHGIDLVPPRIFRSQRLKC